MKNVRIGINGFGRIGRLILRRVAETKGASVIAINDPFITPEYAAYMFKYDTVHGMFKGEVESNGDYLIVNGTKIMFTSFLNASDIPWGKLGVDIVAECTGKYTKKEDAEMHLKQGAKKVVISAPAKGGIPTFVMGVNHLEYNDSYDIVSNSSCTTNCLAPLVKVVDRAFGIEKGLMTTVHSYTATQMIVDGSSKKDWRAGRAGAQNIIPSSTGAAKSIGEVIPHLKGKLTGCSIRVPTVNVSLVILDVELKKPTTYEEICKEMFRASKTDMQGIVEYRDELLVSSDFIGDANTCVFDARAGISLDNTYYKLFAWYDNEWAYSCKLLDLIMYIAKVSKI